MITKKVLLFFTCAALLLAGCAKEQPCVERQEGDLQEITFTAKIESGVATKASADDDGNGFFVNRCIMEIYFQNQLYKRMVQPISSIPSSVSFANVPVVAGKEYRILFWADHVDNNDTDEGLATDKYYETDGQDGLKSVKIVKAAFIGALSDDEYHTNDYLDAFFASDNYTVPQGGHSYNVTLTRPFAQLNVITTDVGEGETVFKEELLPGTVSVSYTAATEINVADGTISEEELFEYTAPVYGSWGTVSTDHHELTLSMAYVLASSEKSAVDVTFATSTGMNYALSNLPFQRNCRTNVKGNLLTANGSWTATIVTAWADGADINFEEVDNISALNTSLAAGANDLKIKLPEDSDATKVVFTSVNNPQDVILDFVGELGSNKTLTFTNAEGANGPRTLTVTAPAGTTLVFEDAQNHVVINGTSYESVQGAFSANTLVISKNVTVGTLTITAGGLQIHGIVNAVGEGLTDNVKVRECEGLSNGVYNALRNYIDAPYYKAVQNGDKWDIVAAEKVASIGEDVYYNLSDAIAAAQSGDEIKLLVDLENIGSNSLPEGVTLNGCDHKISGESKFYISANGGAVKNVVFKDIHNAGNTLSAIYAEGLAAGAEISGCTFDNCDWDAIQIPTENANADIVIKDNVFKAVAKENRQNRFIHIQSGSNVGFKIAVTGNRFEGIYNLKNSAVEIYRPDDFNKVNISGNSLDGNKISVCIANKENGEWTNHIDAAKNWLDADGLPVSIDAAIRADEAAENILLCTTLAVAHQESASWAGSLCIMNEDGLRELSTLVNDGTSFAGKKVSLIDDIDLNNVPFVPIGRMSDRSFAGCFDGTGHTIRNLKIESTVSGAALFGYLAGNKINNVSQPMLVNLTLEDIDIASAKNAAAFVAYDGDDCGIIDNCHVNGGTIVSVPHAVSGGFDDGDKVGGIAGQLYGGHTISNCSVRNLTITAFRDLGGIIGHPNGKCYIKNNTVENVTVYQSCKNAYGSYDTVDEIAGRQKADSELTGNTCTNVVIKRELADGLLYTRNEKLYEISKLAGLTCFRDMVTGGKTFAGETVKLIENLNLASIDNYAGTKGTFSGTFDGNGKTISNLKISGTTNSTAFFGSVWEANIKDFTITEAEVTSTGADYTGILAGNGYAHFDNCTINGTVSGVEQVGAVIGYLSCGHIRNCNVNAAVSASVSRAGILTAKANVDSQYLIEGNTVKGSASSADLYAGGVVGQIMCGEGKIWTIKNNSIDATVSAGGSLIGNVRAGYWAAFEAGYQSNVTGNTWTAEGNCVITDGTSSVEITK